MSASRSRVTVAALLMSIAGGGGVAAYADEVPAAAVAEAEKVWTSRCTHCHGVAGAGDGPASAKLDPKPRTLTDPAWQRGVDDAHIETVIVKGGPAVKLSPFMPGNPDLAKKPDVVHALRLKVRSLQAH